MDSIKLIGIVKIAKNKAMYISIVIISNKLVPVAKSTSENLTISPISITTVIIMRLTKKDFIRFTNIYRSNNFIPNS
jgi:hypothetical protein